MKTTHQIFKETLEELGFAGYKPSQMSNSDYWMCTETAMLRYAEQFKNEWVNIGGIEHVNLTENTILRFDNGDIRRFEEDHPFAESTHIFILPEIPK